MRVLRSSCSYFIFRSRHFHFQFSFQINECTRTSNLLDWMYVHVLSSLLLCCIFEGSKKIRIYIMTKNISCDIHCSVTFGWEQKLYFCYDSSDPVGPSMIPIKTIVIEQVRRDISSLKQAYVKLACNRVISPGISHIACESVETAIRNFMFGCLFSIFHHAIKNVSLIENTDQTFSL